MRDLTRALEGLREDLAGTQHEISVLERIGQELTAIFDRGEDAGTDLLIRRHLDEIARRTAMALARQASIARMMEECGGERRRAGASRTLPIRGRARRRLSFARPIAGCAESQ